MPNYLERVAAAAGRTNTPIRPPAGAPPVMPGPSSFAPAFPVDLEMEGVQPSAVETSRAPDVLPVPTSPISPVPSARVPTPEMRVVGPLPAPAHTPAAPVSPAPSAHVPIPGVQPVVSPGSAAAEKPAAALPGDPFFDPVETRRETGRPIADEIIRAPRSLRPAPDPEMTPAGAGARQGENLAIESLIRAASSTPAVPRRESVPAPTAPQHHPASEPIGHQPDLAATLVASPATPAAEPPPTETIPLLAGLPSMPPARRENTSGPVPMQAQLPELALAAPPLPPAQPRPPEPPAAIPRQSRLTIGRLEVQVANHSPQPPAVRPTRPPNPPQVDILARLYLDRFRLKP